MLHTPLPEPMNAGDGDCIMATDLALCDLCGLDMRAWIEISGDYRRPSATEAFHLYWCQQDKFGKIYPRPTPNQVSGFYEVDSYYTHRPRNGHNESGRTSRGIQRLRHHLAWRFDYGSEMGIDQLYELAGRGARSLLDVGCGSGSRMQQAVEAGFEVVAGIEPDPVAKDIATSRGLNVYAGTAENPSAELSQRSFDVILCMHVLEHTLEPQRAIAALRRMLSPSGCLIVETPNNLAVGSRLAGRSWPWLDVPRHLNFFCSASLQRILEMSGLSIKKVDFCGYTRQFSKEWLEMESRISRFFDHNDRPLSQLELLINELRAWTLLGLTFISPSNIKYDSVRVVAQNQSGLSAKVAR
jgi:2-polyprenyl-3-methyl-5-hydroxy-6-metoxy-1,4-benzoquinol methylase